jgi:hypothetical protein
VVHPTDLTNQQSFRHTAPVANLYNLTSNQQATRAFITERDTSGALYELITNLCTYLAENKASIVNYCQRYWSGQPISSSPAESAANSLVNARMNNKRQMR